MKAALIISFCASLALPAAVELAHAQFSPAFLQNDSYWGDGRAEVDFYDAKVVREGQERHSELQMILALTNFTPARTADDKSSAPISPVPAVRLSQQLTIPLGLVNEQRSSVTFFARDGRLLQSQLATAKPDGVFFATATSRPPKPSSPSPAPSSAASLIQVDATSPGMGSRFVTVDSTGMFCIVREELPLRVRLLDFSKASGDFDLRVIDSEGWDAPPNGPSPAKLSFKTEDRAIEIELREDKAITKFTVDRDFPFLLREWRTADGSTYRLKNSLRADYQKYLKDGDREKALKDPMLRHPD